MTRFSLAAAAPLVAAVAVGLPRQVTTPTVPAAPTTLPLVAPEPTESAIGGIVFFVVVLIIAGGALLLYLRNRGPRGSASAPPGDGARPSDREPPASAP